MGEKYWIGQHKGGKAGRALLKRASGGTVVQGEDPWHMARILHSLEWSVAADRSARTPEEFARAFLRQELGWSCAICLNISKCPHHYFYSPIWTPAHA